MAALELMNQGKDETVGRASLLHLIVTAEWSAQMQWEAPRSQLMNQT